MTEFIGSKQSVSDRNYWTTSYVRWLEDQVANLRQSNAILRRRSEAQEKAQSRRLQQEYDHVEYPDDDYER